MATTIETTFPKNTTKAMASKRREKISFSLTYNALHRNKNYTKEEIQRSWLTTDDLYKIRQSCRRIALKFSKEQPPPNSNNSNNSENDCLRGLEGRTKQGVAKTKKIKWAAKTAVLCEQRLQLLEGIANEKRLADLYYEHTEYPQLEAHMVGLRDQANAKAPCKNDAAI